MIRATGPDSGGMASWWHRDVIAAGKLPLMLHRHLVMREAGCG